MSKIDLDMIEKEQMRLDLPEFTPGDTIKVFFKIIEGEKERTQPFEGVVIAIKGGNNRKSVTVRKVSYSVGVERTFPLHSPRVEKIEIKKGGRVRRAKLYYLRDRIGKSAKLKEETRAQ